MLAFLCLTSASMTSPGPLILPQQHYFVLIYGWVLLHCVYICVPRLLRPLLCWWKLSTHVVEYHPIVYMCTAPPSSIPLLTEVEYSSNTKSHVSPRTWEPNRAVCKFRRKFVSTPRSAPPMKPMFVPQIKSSGKRLQVTYFHLSNSLLPKIQV